MNKNNNNLLTSSLLGGGVNNTNVRFNNTEFKILNSFCSIFRRKGWTNEE